MGGKRGKPTGLPAMHIAPVLLPEFGLDVSWAMCRNPMCAHFGIPFEGTIPAGRRHASDEHYHVRVNPGARGRLVGVIECRNCGQSSQLASDRAIRPIARYFLSLSLPFADCPKVACENHGKNLFETWGPEKRKRPYRRLDAQTARCRACQASFTLGTPRAVQTIPHKAERAKLTEEKERRRAHKAKIRQVRGFWKSIVDGVRSQRKVSGTLDIEEELPPATYYTYLENLGARLHGYHAFRSARLLRADVANRHKPLRLYTDIVEASLKADRAERRHALLPFIVTTTLIKRTVYVLAAHPFFVPQAYCPDEHQLRTDHRRLDFDTDWGAFHHEAASDPTLSTNASIEAVPDLGRGGYFVKSPYAEVAHFLVVQKLLARFGTIHNTMDGSKPLYTAALVAYRERILASRPGADAPDDGREHRKPKAEIVVFQHKKDARNKRETFTERPAGEKTKQQALSRAWKQAEARFREREDPEDLLKRRTRRKDPRVRAKLFRTAFKGAYSEVGKWAWLHYPPPSVNYRHPRTLWLTRMPGKTFARQGKALLGPATLQPVDSIHGSMRSRVLSMGRPRTTSSGRGYLASYALPSVVLAELAIYLLLRNYALRRKTVQTRIPAETMGLVTPGAAEPDILDIAWDFRLSFSHAKRISQWLRR